MIVIYITVNRQSPLPRSPTSIRSLAQARRRSPARAADVRVVSFIDSALTWAEIEAAARRMRARRLSFQRV
jgi:hypothetical protein